MSTPKTKPVFLLVDDSSIDLELIEDAIIEASGKNNVEIKCAENGIAALAFLNNESGYEDEPRPDLIFLDLNMPRMSGRRFLCLMKEIDYLKDIPVVILSSSDDENDIIESVKAGASGYIVKTPDMSKFYEQVKLYCDNWKHGVRNMLSIHPRARFDY
jgi:CheY-like chemotaxis protein